MHWVRQQATCNLGATVRSQAGISDRAAPVTQAKWDETLIINYLYCGVGAPVVDQNPMALGTVQIQNTETGPPPMELGLGLVFSSARPGYRTPLQLTTEARQWLLLNN